SECSAYVITGDDNQSRMCLLIRYCTVEFSTVKISCDSSVHYIPKEIFIIVEIEALLSGLDNSTGAEFESIRPPMGRWHGNVESNQTCIYRGAENVRDRHHSTTGRRIHRHRPRP